MTASPPFEYDVFVDNSHKDAQWVETELVPRLEKNGLRVLFDTRDFLSDKPITRKVEKAVQISRKTLLVLTPDYVQNERTELTWTRALALDPSNRHRRLVLLLKEETELPLALRQLAHLDFTGNEIRQQTWDRLLRALETPDQRKSETFADQDAGVVPEGTRAEASDHRAETSQGNFRARLRQGITDRFSEDELRTLCFDMGLDYDDLPASGKAGKAREFVAQVERKGGIAELIEECRRLRPGVQWMGMPEVNGDVTTFPDDSVPERSRVPFPTTGFPITGIAVQLAETQVPTELPVLEVTAHLPETPAPSAIQAPEVTLPEAPPVELPAAPTPIRIATQALSDKPSDIDLLGFSDYANALADFIKHPKTAKPLTLSIDAPWGMGKTTLMRMLRNRLAPESARELGQEREKPTLRQRPRNRLVPGSAQELGQKREKPTLRQRLRNKLTPERIKTTLKQMLRGRLAPKKIKDSCLTVWFDAWKYDREESLWAALVLEILTQVREQSRFRQRLRIWIDLNRKRFDWPRLLKSILRALAFSAGIVLLGATLYVIFWPLIGTELQSKLSELWIKNPGALLGGAGLVTFTYTLIRDVLRHLVQPFDLGINRYMSESKYRERIGFLEEFEGDFKRVVRTVTQGGKRPLVVFVDDLDRCAPPKPAEIAEAINVLLDAEHCVFVIGMDAQAVACSIESRYKDLAAHYIYEPDGLTLGQRFLEKIVQISFHIPQPTGDQIGSFIVEMMKTSASQPVKRVTPGRVAEAEQLISEQQQSGKSLDEAAKVVERARPDLGKDAVEEAKLTVYATMFEESENVQRAIRDIAPYLENNPRKIKRFINLFRLQALIANRRGLLEHGAIRLDLLAKWAVLSMRWPEGVQVSALDGDFRALAKRLAELVTTPLPLDATWAERAESEMERLMRNRRLRPVGESAQLIELLRAVGYFEQLGPMQPYMHLMGIVTTSSQT